MKSVFIGGNCYVVTSEINTILSQIQLKYPSGSLFLFIFLKKRHLLKEYLKRYVGGRNI